MTAIRSASLASRAARVEAPLDTPFMIDLRDSEAFRADARRAKSLGFQGKLCIHPSQVEPCHEVFSPGPDEIALAERVCRAYEDGLARGLGAVQLDGRLIDYPVVERSRRILEWAWAITPGQR